MKVIIESPYAGAINRNTEYLWRCVKDSVQRGEFPFASHGFYPAVLDESLANERELGIQAGYAWMECADAVIFYTDYGWSPGMRRAKKRAQKLGKFIAHRTIGKNADNRDS